MKRIIWTATVLVLALVTATAAFAQQTTGNITGRIMDDQGAAVPGVTVTARNAQTGFTRSDVSDTEGIYRLNALPVGTYDLTAELQGFSKVDQRGVVVNVGQSLDIAIAMKVASVQENITVTGETPLIETRSSSVGGVVDVARIENLPLTAGSLRTWRPRFPASDLVFIPTRRRVRSSRRRSTAATAATSTIRSTAATTTTIPSAGCCRTIRSRRSRSSTSSRSASRPSTAVATAAS